MDLFLYIFFGTFVLEDVALATSLALIAQGQLTFMLAFWACFLGISIGDLLLYGAGRCFHKIPWLQKISFLQKASIWAQKPENSKFLASAIVISRAAPGTRLPIYFTAGMVNYSMFKFILLTIMSVAAWVFLALHLGNQLVPLVQQHFWWGLLTLIILFKALQFVLQILIDPWKRKSLKYSWRQWLSFEFWPALLFYIPIGPIYIYLAVKHRCLLAPFYANPHVKHGGLIGESKWDFLKYLDTQNPSTLTAAKVNPQMGLEHIKKTMQDLKLSYPVIIKPDVGQRGFGVRILRSEQDLKNYLEQTHFDLIIQRLSQYEKEAGLFYIRTPESTSGFLFSITDKAFPFVKGDGRTSLGELILKDRRAQMIAQTYFSRHHDKLNWIVPQEQIFPISECGNHCQGAIFLNGQDLKTPELEKAIDQISRQIPDFYFGRLDIRYKDHLSLQKGLDFEILEVNGAGAEATHIWDSRTSLLEAYKTLFQQWSYLFAIGAQVKTLNPHLKANLGQFFWESFKVFRRQGPLTVSS